MHIQSYIKEIRKAGKRCFTIQDVVDKFGASRGLVIENAEIESDL